MDIRKILVVDDSLVTRMKVKKTLSEIDEFDISEASNGIQCLELINKQYFDLIILDLIMPDMTGFPVLEEMKKKSIDIPVIVLSADIQKTTKKKCLDLGAIDVLPKTVDFSELKSKIIEMIKIEI